MQRISHDTILHWLGFYAASAILYGLFAVSAFSQSRDQGYPTAVSTNEISGAIKARDVGDPRDTAYFYTFNGNQGDIFVNIVTKNFNGSIDIFAVDGLRPLSQVVIYADATDSETGRVIYLRKPERLLLRIEGRTPNDDAASYRIKFAGSFVAVVAPSGSDLPKLPEIRVENDSGIRVNSVGTIIEVIPKTKPAPKADAAKDDRKSDEKDAASDSSAKQVTPVAEDNKSADNEKEVQKKGVDEKGVEVLVTENLPPPTEIKAVPTKNPARGSRRPKRRRGVSPPKPIETAMAENTPADSEVQPKAKETKPAVLVKRAPKPKPPDPLAEINLVVLFKDGRRIEKPMSEVLRFTVDRGVLTVILKNGQINRYSILDVEKVTINNQLPQQ